MLGRSLAPLLTTTPAILVISCDLLPLSMLTRNNWRVTHFLGATT